MTLDTCINTAHTFPLPHLKSRLFLARELWSLVSRHESRASAFQRLWCHQRNIGIICIWSILSIIHSLWIYYLGHLGSHKTALCQWYQCMRSRGNVFLITYAKVHKGALFFQYGGAITPDPSRVFKNNNNMATLPPKRNRSRWLGNILTMIGNVQMHSIDIFPS